MKSKKREVKKKSNRYDVELDKLPPPLLSYRKPKVHFDKILAVAGFSIVYEGQTGSRSVAIKRIKIRKKDRFEIFCLRFRNLFKKKSIEENRPKQRRGKKINRPRFVSSERVCKEVEILKLCQSKYVLKYLDCYKERSYISIITELGSFSAKNFCDNIGRNREKVKPNYRLSWHIMTPIFEAVAHIHSLGIVHRDIKPENILIDWRGVPKLSDFGLAIKVDELVFNNKLIGTPAYIAPEIYRCEEYGLAVDIFALGYCIIELRGGHCTQPPEYLLKFYTEDLPERKKRGQKNGKANYDIGCFRLAYYILLGEFNKTLWDEYEILLLQKMITLYPSNRISAEDLCQEPLIKALRTAWDGDLEEVFSYNTALFNKVLDHAKNLQFPLPYFY